MKYRWMVLLAVPAILLAMSSTSSRAQGVPTPNAMVSALQTQAAGLENQLPGLRADEQKARDDTAAANANLNAATNRVNQTQGNLNNTNAAINRGLGQQALEMAGQVQGQVNDLQGQIWGWQQQVNGAVGALDRAAGAYRTAVPAVAGTAQAVVASAARIVPDIQAQAEFEAHKKDEQYQSERTTERIVYGVGLLAVGVIVYVLRGRHPSTPLRSALDAGQPPVSDRERLPQQPVDFVESEDLGEYFGQGDHQ